MEVADLLPGMRLAGANEQAAPTGKFEHVSTTALWTAPETEVTVNFVDPDLPTAIVKEAGAAPRLI